MLEAGVERAIALSSWTSFDVAICELKRFDYAFHD